MRKTNPITRIKRGKGVLVKFYSSNRVSLLYFESQSRVTVSLRKHTYSSCGSLTRLISRKNIDIGSDFKKKNAVLNMMTSILRVSGKQKF